LISSLGQLFSCGESDLLENLNKQKENNSRLSGENQRLKQKILSLIAEQMKQNVQEIGGFRVAVQLVEDLELADLNKLASMLLGEKTADIVLLAAEQPRPGVLYAGSSEKNLPDLRLLLRETQSLFGGKGGGSPDRVQAGGTDPTGLLPALEKAKELLISAAGKNSVK
jgi:alanyl-tRNA synthetase